MILCYQFTVCCSRYFDLLCLFNCYCLVEFVFMCLVCCLFVVVVLRFVEVLCWHDLRESVLIGLIVSCDFYWSVDLLAVIACLLGFGCCSLGVIVLAWVFVCLFVLIIVCWLLFCVCMYVECCVVSLSLLFMIVLFGKFAFIDDWVAWLV